MVALPKVLGALLRQLAKRLGSGEIEVAPIAFMRGRTLTNARALMKQLGVAAKEIDIRPLCLAEWKALGHQPFAISP